MTRTRWVLLGTMLALGAVVLAPRSSSEGPFVPASGEQVVEKVPAGGEARRARAAVRAALTSRPDDVEAAVKLARSYLEQARAEGNDVRLIGRAQAALAPWWSVPHAPPAVRLLRAMVKQSLHDFPGARVDLDALVAADPDDIQAWLTRATVATVVGDYAEAEKSCAALNGHAQPMLEVVCRAPLAAFRGDAAAGAAAIEAVTPVPGDERPFEERANGAQPVERRAQQGSAHVQAWALSVTGELRAWAGDAAAAEAKFAAALKLAPQDDYTRGAWADLLLDAQRPAEVVKLLTGQENNDALLLRLCLAQRAGSTEPTACPVLTARVAATRQRGDTVHRREEARFALHIEGDAGKALELAVANFQVQREPADVRVLLEAALAANQPAAAAPAMAWMKSTGFQSPPLRALVARLEGAK